MIDRSTYFFLLFFVGCTTAALVQRRILREISAETLSPQPADANTIVGGAEDRGGTTSSTSTATTLKPLCSYSEPCGWAVYEKYTRTFQYYMDNVCRCPSHKHCHRTGDDLTNNAYVYTCIQEEINETIAWVHPPPPPTPTHRWEPSFVKEVREYYATLKTGANDLNSTTPATYVTAIVRV